MRSDCEPLLLRCRGLRLLRGQWGWTNGRRKGVLLTDVMFDGGDDAKGLGTLHDGWANEAECHAVAPAETVLAVLDGAGNEVGGYGII